MLCGFDVPVTGLSDWLKSTPTKEIESLDERVKTGINDSAARRCMAVNRGLGGTRFATCMLGLWMSRR